MEKINEKYKFQYVESIVYDQNKCKNLIEKNLLNDNFFDALYEYIINNNIAGTITENIGNRLLDIISYYRFEIYKSNPEKINKCNIMIILINNHASIPNEFFIFSQINERGIKTIPLRNINEKYTEEEKEEVYKSKCEDYKILSELTKDNQKYINSLYYIFLVKNIYSIAYFLRTVKMLKTKYPDIIEDVNVKSNIECTLDAIKANIEELKHEKKDSIYKRFKEIMTHKYNEDKSMYETKSSQIIKNLEIKEEKLIKLDIEQSYNNNLFSEIDNNLLSLTNKNELNKKL